MNGAGNRVAQVSWEAHEGEGDGLPVPFFRAASLTGFSAFPGLGQPPVGTLQPTSRYVGHAQPRPARHPQEMGSLTRVKRDSSISNE
jgi:hypothetical protein